MEKAACTLKIGVQAAFWALFGYPVDGVVDSIPILHFIHNKKCRLLSNKTKSSLHLILNDAFIVYAKSANSAVER